MVISGAFNFMLSIHKIRKWTFGEHAWFENLREPLTAWYCTGKPWNVTVRTCSFDQDGRNAIYGKYQNYFMTVGWPFYLYTERSNLLHLAFVCVKERKINFSETIEDHYWIILGEFIPLSVICQHFQTTSPLKPWIRFLPNFTFSIYRPGKRIFVFFFQSDKNWLLWQLIVAIDLKWEKWKLAFIAISLQIFWQTFYRNPLPNTNFVQTAEFDWLPWQQKD